MILGLENRLGSRDSNCEFRLASRPLILCYCDKIVGNQKFAKSRNLLTVITWHVTTSQQRPAAHLAELISRHVVELQQLALQSCHYNTNILYSITTARISPLVVVQTCSLHRDRTGRTIPEFPTRSTFKVHICRRATYFRNLPVKQF